MSAVGRHQDEQERPSKLFIEVSCRLGEPKIERFVIVGGAWEFEAEFKCRSEIRILSTDHLFSGLGTSAQ